MQFPLISGLPFLGRRVVSPGPAVCLLINCDEPPPGLFGWEVAEHLRSGLLPWDESRVVLSVRSDRREKYCDLSRIRLALKMPFRPTMMNANVAAFLIENQFLISKGWRAHGAVGFPGTVYRNGRGERLCPMLSLSPETERWFLGYFSLKEKWPRARPVACWA